MNEEERKKAKGRMIWAIVIVAGVLISWLLEINGLALAGWILFFFMAMGAFVLCCRGVVDIRKARREAKQNEAP